jgi:hypothetical protein
MDVGGRATQEPKPRMRGRYKTMNYLTIPPHPNPLPKGERELTGQQWLEPYSFLSGTNRNTLLLMQ